MLLVFFGTFPGICFWPVLETSN